MRTLSLSRPRRSNLLEEYPGLRAQCLHCGRTGHIRASCHSLHPTPNNGSACPAPSQPPVPPITVLQRQHNPRRDARVTIASPEPAVPVTMAHAIPDSIPAPRPLVGRPFRWQESGDGTDTGGKKEAGE
jgi:hypothetical protein